MTEQVPKETVNKTVKADFNYMGRDLFWKYYDLQDGFIRWTGYDDANWWNNVSPNVREMKGKSTGRTYRIDFETETVEVIGP